MEHKSFQNVRELTIASLARMNSSTNGHPRYEVSFTNGDLASTGIDSSVAYEIDNPEYRNVPVLVTFTGAGRIVGIAHAPRTLSVIAREIIADYPKAGNENHPAGAYVIPMASLDKMGDTYGAESADSIIRYALSNLTGWRGETARRVKAELKGMLK